MIDVIQHINSVRREVGTSVLESGTARSVTVSQAYNATVADLWDACTNPERIARWFLPISGDLRLGGRYQFEGNAGGIILDLACGYGEFINNGRTLKDPARARCSRRGVEVFPSRLPKGYLQFGRSGRSEVNAT